LFNIATHKIIPYLNDDNLNIPLRHGTAVLTHQRFLSQSGIMGIRVSLNKQVAEIEGGGFCHGGILLGWHDSPKKWVFVKCGAGVGKRMSFPPHYLRIRTAANQGRKGDLT
jgi:hypothetical protein